MAPDHGSPGRGWLDEHLVAGWLDEQVVGDRPLTLRRDRELDPAITIAAAQRLWARIGWPRGEMTQAHWLRLAETLRGHDFERYTLPSGVDVLAEDHEVTLNRNFDG